MNVTCPCGAKSPEFERTSNVGEARRRSGFFPVFDHAGKIHYICPNKCLPKVREAAIAFVEVFGPDDAPNVFLGSIVKLVRGET